MTTCRRRTAILGLAFLCVYGADFASAADVSVSAARTTPVATSTADGTNAGNVTVTSTGSVTTATGPSVTLDSDNTILNQGKIAVTSDTGAVAVLLNAGHTGSFTSDGTVSALIVDSDDITTGSGNIAIWISGSGTFIGNINLEDDSTTSAGGTNSIGLAIDAAILGDITIAGGVEAHGTGATAFSSTASIDGDLLVTADGSVAASGEGARAFFVGAPVTGGIINRGAIGVIGAQSNVDYDDGDDDTEVIYPMAEFAVGIAGSSGSGFLNGSAGSIMATYTDTGVIISPSLAAVPADIVLGVVDATDNPYGFVNIGSIGVSGAFEGQTIRGVWIEGYDDGSTISTVTLDGGFYNSGSIAVATTADATAYGVVIGDYTNVPTLLNAGTMTSTVTSSETATAYGLVIGAEANLPVLNNSGTLSATATADDAYAYGIVDNSGTLLSLTNSGTLYALATSTADIDDPGDDDVDGDIGDGAAEAVVLDLRHANGATTIANSGSIYGATQLSSQNDTVNLIDDGDDDEDTTSAWTGSIGFGGGDDTFTISGAGIFTGGIAQDSGTLAIIVEDGTFSLGRGDTVDATTIDFSSAAALTIELDGDNNAIPRIDATERITFEEGARIEATLTEFVGEDFTAILARAPLIESTVSGSDLVVENLPYLYTASTALNDGAQDEIVLSFHLKTATDLAFTARQTAFYGSVLDVLAVTDNALAEPLLALDERAEFLAAYDALMPNTAQPVLRGVMALTDALDGAIKERFEILLGKDKNMDGVHGWWSGTARGILVDPDDNGQGIDGDLTAVTFGIEGLLKPYASIGAAVSLGTSTMFEDGSTTDRVRLNSGHGALYASFAAGPVYLSASAGGGYSSNRSDRQFTTDDFTLDIEDQWDSTFVDASAEAGLNVLFGKFAIRPSAGVTWLNLSEDAHAEDSGGVGFDLSYDALEVDVTRAKAGLVFSYTKSDNHNSLTPQFNVSWSERLNDQATELEGRFVGADVPFTLATTPLAQQVFAAGLGVTVITDGTVAGLAYDASLADGEFSHGARLNISMPF